MHLIPDDASLRRYIPNVMATLPGDRSLFDRISPQLLTSQQWLEANLIEHTLIEHLIEFSQSDEEPLYHLPRMATALRAWRSAIPSLDIVVTANGLAAVETKTTKPASAAKIERLISSVSSDLNRVLLLLLGELQKLPAWHMTEAGRRFSLTLFNSSDDVSMLVGRFPGIFTLLDSVNDTVIDRYLSGISHLRQLEDAIAGRWLSHKVMDSLRHHLMESRKHQYSPGSVGLRLAPVEFCSSESSADKIHLRVIGLVKRSVMRMLASSACSADSVGGSMSGSWPVGQGDIPADQFPEIEEAVNIVCSRSDIWPEFRSTPQGERLLLKGFRNSRKSRGYFF